MLNMLRMDLYRMFRTRSMYIIWMVIVVALLFTTFLCKSDIEMADSTKSAQTEQITEPTVDDLNVGMSVELPTKPGEKVSVCDIFFANSQGKFYALFLVIFAVIFSTDDIGNGYIKNIGGQVKKRGRLVFSRAAALGVFTIITMVMVLLLQIVINEIVFGYVKFGNAKEMLPYFLTEIVLHYALVLVCMAIAIVFRNNVVSIVAGVCLTMNIMNIVYGVIDNAIAKAGIHNFEIYDYTITGKLSLLSMNPGTVECAKALGVALVFIVAMTVMGSVIFQKRDI